MPRYNSDRGERTLHSLLQRREDIYESGVTSTRRRIRLHERCRQNYRNGHIRDSSFSQARHQSVHIYRHSIGEASAPAKAPAVTPGLRPGYDLPATEKWANRRKNVRLMAEVVGDRKGQISRNKVVVMFKTRSHRAYDQVTTYLRSKNVGMMGQS